jgi:DNA processing protein
LSKGCHWLIKQGAKLVETAQDVLEELGMVAAPALAQDEGPPLQPHESGLLTAMGFEPVDLDTICQRAHLAPDAASALLLKLELDGYLSWLPGGLLQRLR